MVSWKMILVSNPSNWQINIQESYCSWKVTKKVEKCKLDINFFVRCQECNRYPSFTKANCLKDMSKKVRNTYQRRLLLDEISNKHEQFKSLNKQLTSETDDTLLIIKKKDISWIILKEAYMIKTHWPSLNCGLKRSEELQLF